MATVTGIKNSRAQSSAWICRSIQIIRLTWSSHCLLAGLLMFVSIQPLKAQNNDSNIIQSQPLPQIGQPQPAPNRPKPVLRKPPDRRPVIGMIAGPYGSAILQMTSELAQIVSPDRKLRIVPLIGDTQRQNLNDIFWLKGVDLAIIQLDTLNWAKTSRTFKPLISRLRYITELSSSEVHILANSDIRNISELKGKKVNLGVDGTQTAMTAGRIFETLNIKVEPVHLGLRAAIHEIREKTLTATIFISGKPAPGLVNLRRADGLKLLNIDYSDELSSDFTPEIISHEDYPNLITKQEAISTISVSNILMVYNWNSTNPRYQKVAKFVDILFSNLDKLRSDAFHPKWREISPTLEIEGWTRFKSAQDWLKKNRPNYASAGAPAELKAAFEFFLKSQGGGAADILTGQERELLFNRFVRWRSPPAGSDKSK